MQALKPKLVGILAAAAIAISGGPTQPSTDRDIHVPRRNQPILPSNDALRSTHRFSSYTGRTTYTATGKQILTDEELHRSLAWMTYDNIPEPYHAQLLDDLEARFDKAMHDTTLSDDAYRELPTPVRHVNLLTRLRSHANNSRLQDDYETTDDAVRALGTTIMTESFFDQDARNPPSGTMRAADLGYAQVSPWTRAYMHKHSGYPEPSSQAWYHVDTQARFITEWLAVLNDERTPNRVAHASYVEGKQAALDSIPEAMNYAETWRERRKRYFEATVSSQTWQWVLSQAGLGDRPSTSPK